MGVTGTLTASAWTDFMGTGHDLAQATGANQPIYLPFTGEKYAYFPQVSGNNFSTPASVANKITGDIDIRINLAMDDWTPSADMQLIGRDNVTDQRSYFLQMQSDNRLHLFWTEDGSTGKNEGATAATGFTDGTAHWVRATLDVDNGAAGHDVAFYTSSDGSTWTQLGTTVTTAGTTSIWAGTEAMRIGANGVPGNSMFKGKVYRAKIYNGIGGTLVVDFNADLSAETSTNAATFTAATGEVWTLNSTGATPAQIVGSPSLFGDGTNHKMATANFTLDQPCEYFLVAKPITWTAGDYLCSGTVGAAGITQLTGTPKIGLNAGSGVADNANAVLGAYAIIYAALNGASSELQVNLTAATTGNAGAGNPGGLSLFSDNAGANYGNWQVKEKIARSVVSSAATRLAIQQRLAALHGISI